MNHILSFERGRTLMNELIILIPSIFLLLLGIVLIVTLV